MNTPQFLSRGIDYLGDLGAKLRDLQGFKTLAHELIQNADDVPDATAMTFNICDDMLIVDNDGIFSDCGQVEQNECPWKNDSRRGHRCDFHRFRFVAAGDKRAEEGTTGAFGIGFIATYQITDQPELISAGRHWILHEERPENERVQVCPGCEKCAKKQLPGTRFIFTWAKDPHSHLRQALRAEVLSEPDIETLLHELENSLPPSMLFLKRLRFIELKRNGESYRLFQRLDEGDSLILSDGNLAGDRVWHMLNGDFGQEAEALRAKHPGRIEPKRSSRVTVAIPEENACNGLFCVFLPTEQETGFPFHINADFFPSNDRKRLNLTASYEAEWNRAAIQSAAKTLAQSLHRLPELLGHRQFWALLDSVKKVSDEAVKTGKEPTLSAFWRLMSPILRTAAIVFTTKGEWTTPSQCCLLLQREETAAVALLESLGIKIVSEDLRPFQSLLRNEVVGVLPLGIPAFCDALSAIGFDRPCQDNEWQFLFADKKDLKVLWEEIALLRNREKRTKNIRSEQDIRLKSTAIAPVLGGALFPCAEAYHADESTISLFSQICPDIPFLSDDPDFEALRDLCPTFDAAAALGALDSLGSEEITNAWADGRLDLKQLFAWFENHRLEILEDPQARQQFNKLTIFPSSGQLRKLGAVALPGDFNDHLGLAEIVDLQELGGRRDLLRDLGMQALDFKTYALRLPDALSNPDIAVEKRRRAVSLLAERIGEIRDDPQLLKALASKPLVECSDGMFHEAGVCYFYSDTVEACLGASVFSAVIPEIQSAACQSLYELLGVTAKPRIADLIGRIEWIAVRPYSADLLLVVLKIITHLGNRFRNEEPPSELESLCKIPWLPANGRSDRWYRPDELYAVYQDYLFETTALFLNVPRNIQNASRVILEFIGVHITPDADLVVRHLQNCCNRNQRVNSEVYHFLNDKADNPALIQLKGKKCLYIGEHYLSPDQVFWGEHPFGSYRQRLGEELRAYGNLLKRLGVRDGPDHSDALAVMKEIATAFEATKKPLDDETLAVILSCWRLLEAAIDRGHFNGQRDAQSLQGLACVPNSKRMLNPPEWMFFENRAGLAEKFDKFLLSNVISRPIGAAVAMASAGVRPLSTAVDIQLLECEDPTQDVDIAERIRSRRNTFGRILDAQKPSECIHELLERLNDIRFEKSRSLIIRYQLHAFNRVLESKPEASPALYLAAENRLIFTHRNGQMAWPALSRELAIALLPEEDPGRIAAGIKEVLAAESGAQAAQTLDELGYSRLDTTTAATPIGMESVTTLGTDAPTGEVVCPDDANKSATPGGSGGMSPTQAVETLLGPGAPKPTPPAPEMEPEPPPTGGPGGRQKRKGTAEKKKRPVLRSYLPSPDLPLEMADESEQEPLRSPVDEAGIKRVIEYEKCCGRHPKEMPHHQPGYDIETRNSAGKILRYIEVKSLSGPWSIGYAVLSRAQFDTASRLGNDFWLYVVDQAQTDAFRIYRMQNPAQKANHFMFDDGWRSVAEIDEFSRKNPVWEGG